MLAQNLHRLTSDERRLRASGTLCKVYICSASAFLPLALALRDTCYSESILKVQVCVMFLISVRS
jgi:hypothetical protein